MWGLVQSVNSIRSQLYRSLIGQILFFLQEQEHMDDPHGKNVGSSLYFSEKPHLEKET